MKLKRSRINKIPDCELISLWKESACKEYPGVLILRYIPYLYGVCLKYSPSQESAKNDLMDFSRDFPGLLQSCTEGVDFQGWLYAQVVKYEKNRHPLHVEDRATDRLTAAEGEIAYKLAFADKETLELFEKEKGKLPKPQRVCIELFLLKGETFENIADQAGYLTDNVRHYIETGVAALVSSVKKSTQPIATFDFSSERIYDKFVRYIKGERADADAHEIELYSMFDPFLSDALEGYLSVPSEHPKMIGEVTKDVEAIYFVPEKKKIWQWIILAILLVLCVIFVYFRFFYAMPDRNRINAVEKIENKIEIPKNQETEDILDAATVNEEENKIGEDRQTITPQEQARTDALSPQDADLSPARVAETVTVPEKLNGIVSLVSISTEVDANGKVRYTSSPMIGGKTYDEYLAQATVPLEEKVSGDVTITFYVNRYGRPSQMRVTEYLSQEAHREVIRLLDNGPEWAVTDKQVTVIMRFRR